MAQKIEYGVKYSMADLIFIFKNRAIIVSET